ncbi:MAG: GTP-binding protein [Verrucomicrobiales bacterium]
MVERGEHKVTFIDTPGHQAFAQMRARGANITDIVVLVIAADDGIMPTTIEAIEHARKAGVSIVVAINKVDLERANLMRVMSQLQERDLAPEAWGDPRSVSKCRQRPGKGWTNSLKPSCCRPKFWNSKPIRRLLPGGS